MAVLRRAMALERRSCTLEGGDCPCEVVPGSRLDPEAARLRRPSEPPSVMTVDGEEALG